MAFIKKLVVSGFKSFATKTEIPFDKDISVIIGPNGSGKSNISDALCFVLGRLSSKSMRAAKSSNLIFQGTKAKKPGKEASVDLVFDNQDKSFNIDSNELHIKRIVRKKGTSIYKINNETKTRQEVLETLAQAGIDPNGFNIILQGGISRLVKMRPDERREIIEEVAGISIYESRKQKALHEIEKTEQKIKEVNAVLRERTSYLKNLDQERKQALKFKELQKTIQQCKASILKKNIDEKTKNGDGVQKEIEKNQKYRDKFREEIEKINTEISEKEDRINEINDHIQKTTGFERESLNDEITDLNAKIAADMARKENFEKKSLDNEQRKSELTSNIKETENELEELRKKSPIISRRQQELKNKKSELEKIEELRSQLYGRKTEFSALKDRIRDKEKLLQRFNSDSKFLFGQINSLSESVTSQTTQECETQISNTSKKIIEIESKLKTLNNSQLENEKLISILQSNIKRHENLKSKIPDSNTCPICQTKLTKDHISHVVEDANQKINSNNKKITEIKDIQKNLNQEHEDFSKNFLSLKETLTKKQSEILKLNQIEEKREQMKKTMENENTLKKEIKDLKLKKDNLEEGLNKMNNIEERYDKLFFEMQEISSRTDENLDTNILYKEREIENINNVIKNIDKDQIEISKEITHLTEDLNENQNNLTSKEKASEELNKKFKRLYDERTQFQEKIRQLNTLMVNKQNALSRFQDLINQFKIDKAKISATIESYEFEFKEFQGVNIIKGPILYLEEKLRKSENSIATIGSVNLRALEVYDKIKEEYEAVYQKVEQLESERGDILKIISEIDIKKKKTFMKTFNAINDLFTENFSQLSPKGKAYLEIQNKEDIFEGGVDITMKIAKGKYFDVSSLSGGEQTLVALSLIFSIQKFNPYAFYILDEIDAALDKRNSELLANLLKKYMQSGQYIVISHNDSIISGSNTLYGVSMNQGISKITSLKLEEMSGDKPQ
jgi:chromosome segregation protein